MTPAPFVAQVSSLDLPWSKVALNCLHFVASFAIFGGLGFRFFVTRRALGESPYRDFAAQVREPMESGAAQIGFVGALLLLTCDFGLASRNAYIGGVGMAVAARKAGPFFLAEVACALLLLVAFALARRNARAAWSAAAFFATAMALRKITTGNWLQLMSPLHEVAAALWLGTLLVLVAIGVPAVLRHATAAEARSRLTADLVTRFSSLALGGAALLGVTGVIIAWVHLKYVAALWTTPYGYVLDAKLVVVAIIAGLGAWNWRRQTPRLATDDGIHALCRSSKQELAFAVLTLLLTAVLVVLPTPKLP